MLYNVGMATTRIYGVDERPSQPSFYIPNRVDEESLGALVKALGGVENVAFMVEEVLKPAPEVMKLVNTSVPSMPSHRKVSTGRVLVSFQLIFDVTNLSTPDF